MKESNLSKQFLPKWQQENGKDSHLFRNNTGGAYVGNIEKHGPNILIKNQQWITFGIGILKKIKNKFRPVGGGDYVGWTSKALCDLYRDARMMDFTRCPYRLVNPDCKNCDLNQKIAIFTSIEFKTKNVYETQDQKDWKALVLKSGGIAEVVKEGEF